MFWRKIFKLTLVITIQNCPVGGVASDDFVLRGNIKIDKSNIYNHYARLSIAKLACRNDSKCMGVYVSTCNENGPYMLIKDSFLQSISGTDCIYKRTRYEPRSECYDVSMYKPTPDFGWSFGNCSDSHKWVGSGVYTDMCCISEGWHILTCRTSSHGQHDWSNTILMMLGHQFCDDFAGHNAYIPLNASLLTLSFLPSAKVSMIDEAVYKGWLQYPSYCVSSTNMDLQQTHDPDGDNSVEKCKSLCNRKKSCSAIEWNTLVQVSAKCNLILGDIPATKGVFGDGWQQPYICYVKPTYESDSCERRGYFLQQYATGSRIAFSSLADAKSKCITVDDCIGLTQEHDSGEWTLRKFEPPLISTAGEISMLRSCFRIVAAKDYSLTVGLIPRSIKNGCSTNKIHRSRFSTCSCDAHCSWDLCRSSIPPSNCLLGMSSIWILDNIKDAWVAQYRGDGNETSLTNTVAANTISKTSSTSSIPPMMNAKKFRQKTHETKQNWYDFNKINLKVLAGVVTAIAVTSLLYLMIFPKMVLKDPMILWNRILVIFDVICFLLALCMTLKNIGRFHEDKNATVITYKKLGHTIEDKYPSFSLCFEGNNLYRFNESAIFTAYGIHLSDYERMLNGKLAYQYDYDHSRKRYNKKLLPSKYEPSIGFETNDLFQLPDIVQKTSFVAEDHNQDIYFGEIEVNSDSQVSKEAPFYISYQSLQQFCLTREQRNALDFHRQHDSVVFDLSFLDPNTKIKVFIHYPGQAIRSFESPRVATLLNRVQNKEVNLRVSQTTLLRKRSAQNDRCNKDIDDHDSFLLNSVSNETGCIPPYWSSILRASSSLCECSSPDQLKKAYSLTKDIKKILENRLSPCLDMFNSVIKNEAGINDWEICEKCTYLEIEYMDKYYEEIKEIKEFGFEDFVSGLGGFIGIFLGYSLMQIPQLLGIAMHHIRLGVSGLGVYLKAVLDRNREMSKEKHSPGVLIEVQDLAQIESVGALKIETDRINIKLSDFKAQIIETFRKDIERSEEKIIATLREN